MISPLTLFWPNTLSSRAKLVSIPSLTSLTDSLPMPSLIFAVLSLCTLHLSLPLLQSAVASFAKSFNLAWSSGVVAKDEWEGFTQPVVRSSEEDEKF